MEIRFQTTGWKNWKAGAILAFVFEGENPLVAQPLLDQVCPWLAVAPAKGDFKGKSGEIAVIYGHPDLDIPRVMLLGLGKKEKYQQLTFRKAIASACRKARDLGVKSLLLPQPFLEHLPGGRDRLTEDAVCAALLGLYRFTALKTDTEELQPDPQWLAIGFEDKDAAESGQKAARAGELAAEATALARDLDNLPGNLLYPEAMALRAASLAQESGFSCRILSETELDSLGMGCLLAVGRGSGNPPRLIILEHAPKGTEEDKPFILIGKGITFDSGGLCLKPAARMGEMKCDMSGAGAVLATINALAKAGTQRRVIGILSCAENMPDGRAFRPGDVLTSCNGKTVEVINTDAEGRLVLCDAIAYACSTWKPAAILDIATLTGAIAVALGDNLAGLFCNDDALATRIMAYGKAAGENYWRMPLWEEYQSQLKSVIADMKHTGGREGGSIVAALFLQKFVGENIPWAHLDIASVDWNVKDKPLCTEGPTGFGCRTLLAICQGGLS